jgi:hypothetical protein
MYIRLSKIMTKAYFKTILHEALAQAKEEYNSTPDIQLYASIYNQLIDIRENIIDKEKVLTEEEAYEKYSLGVIAVRNFSEQEGNYPKKLSDIAWGISHYPTMAEE